MTATTNSVQRELNWRDDALCRETGLDLHFPEKGESPRDALMICNRCRVATECLAYALDTGQRFGVWGGLTERQRRRLQRQAAA